MSSTTLTAVPVVPERTSQNVAAAARSLVAARDGLMATLLHLAEHTACDAEDHAVSIVSPLLAALPAEEQHRWTVGLVVRAYAVYGRYDPANPTDRDGANDLLIAWAQAAADRVIRVLRVDACLCREVRS